MNDISGSNALMVETDDGRWLLNTTLQVMDVRSARWIAGEEARGIRRIPIPSGERALEMRGRLFVDSERAYRQLSEQFRDRGYLLLLRRQGSDHLALAVPGRLPEGSGRPWVALALFAATFVSVLLAGAAYEQQPDAPLDLLSGLPFALSLLGILLAHEMGHYLVARWQGMPASFPYFIPMPVFPLGTMGAVIVARAPSRNRRQQLLVGAAGPLAGLVVAVPVLLLGLTMSRVGINPPFGYMQEGNSLLYAALKLVVFGQFLPWGNVDVQISSVAWAGWAGLLVTAMNLIPAGQLDGGHIAYAVLGQRARYLTWAVVAALLGLSTLWQGWLLWAVLVVVMARVHSVPLDDVTRLRTRERTLAALSLLLFVLVFIPIPLVIK